ncbi:hypothetical protein KTN05_06610 [Paracoccus sp. Z118]|uniref:hypothetical protein n=1 Tax=Paracoccus sp. Z118 TaxID=2851017 RepID=UPI001C2C7BEA|nr:hypothetical protein [Paracoccus sp. Z118]MBV0891527.1 hypothetical protein [Paracoccus sp. Z118]
MPSPNLAAPHVAASQNQKEVTINDATDALDLAITASLGIDCSAGGSISVTSDQARRHVRLSLTGTPAGDFTLLLPAVPRMVLIQNATGRQVTVKNASGATVVLGAGIQSVFYSSGSGVSVAGSASAAPAQVYDFGMLTFSTPGASETLGKVTIPRAVSLPADLAGSAGHVDVNPAASFEIDVTRNGVSVGTITISTAGAVSFATAGAAAVVLAARRCGALRSALGGRYHHCRHFRDHRREPLVMPLLFSSLFSTGAGAAPPEPVVEPVSFVDGVAIANQTANGSRTLSLTTHQPGDLLVAMIANRESTTPPDLLAGYSDVVSAAEGATASAPLSGYRGYRMQVKVATSSSETISWTGAYGFLIALRGANYIGRVGQSVWRGVVGAWLAPALYDLDISGMGFLLSGTIGSDVLGTVNAPYQVLAPASTSYRFAAFRAQNTSERMIDLHMVPPANWNANFWSVEFLPVPPATVAPPAGAWLLDATRTQAGYQTWRGGLAVVNAIGGQNLQGFVPTVNSFSSGKRYWEVECSAGLTPTTNYNGYMGIVTEEHRSSWGSSNPLNLGSIGYRGDGSIWSTDGSSPGSVRTGMASYRPADVLMFAFDPATRGLWVGKNGVWSNNPDTQSPTYAAGVGSVWYPVIQGREPNEGGSLRSLASQFSYPIPASCIPLG